MVIAESDGTMIRALAANFPPRGETVTVAIRPERLRFADSHPDMPRANRMWATITEAMFAGERRRYQCRCAGGVSIVVKEPSGATSRRRAEGEHVELVWSVADTVVV
jgi:ABC-type Fe3+/spermidine/putrescine transport system ATPase subunit